MTIWETTDVTYKSMYLLGKILYLHYCYLAEHCKFLFFFIWVIGLFFLILYHVMAGLCPLLLLWNKKSLAFIFLFSFNLMTIYFSADVADHL